MTRWFRMYDELLDDPKVQRLSGDDFKAWVNLLCLASRNDGRLPSAADVAFALRLAPAKASAMIAKLVTAGLLDPVSGGYEPHGWNVRQYKSDVSTDRVKRFRQRSKTATVTPPETEAETDVPLPNGNGAIADPGKDFWDAAKGYLGTNKASLIGKWCGVHGQPATAQAITEAMLKRPPDPVSYIQGIFRAHKAEAESVPVC